MSPTLEFTHNSTIQKYFSKRPCFCVFKRGSVWVCPTVWESDSFKSVLRQACMHVWALRISVTRCTGGAEWPLIFNVRIRHVVKQRQERLQPAFTSTASESMSVFTLITIRSKQRLSNQGISTKLCGNIRQAVWPPNTDTWIAVYVWSWGF